MDDNIFITRLVVGALSANCYIVGSKKTGKGLVIDPGGNEKEIIRVINESYLEIQTIVLTHGHADHLAALYDIQRHTGAEVAIHRADGQSIRGHGEYSMMFGISFRTPASPPRLLDEGEIIQTGDMRLKVIHTPGHTPGSICLQMDNRVFTGDTLMHRGIGTTLMPGSSRRQLIDSIHRRLMVLPDDTVIYPGHGRQTTIAAERRHNPFLN
ncbi:MAG: MBL fold metallo-hydrolase [Dehalococcoidales bacterium]|nr:MBL fold metallo-hydrolase [Dehalococcoidales bacterium]